MSTEFQFSSHFLNTHVFILDCLPSRETSRERLYNPLRDLAYRGIRKTVNRWCASDSRALTGQLRTIAVWAAAGIMPLIHIECHGSEDVGLEIGDSHDVMDWASLTSELRRVNASSRGNLGVVMGVCEGISATEPVDIDEPSPFCFLVGSNGHPTNGVLQDEMPAFYRTLFESYDVNSALGCVPSFQTYYAEQMLITRLLLDIAEGCLGRERAKWRERWLSKVVESHGGSIETASLRAERAKIKTMTGEDGIKDAIKVAALRFLHRPPSFDIDELLAHAHNLRTLMPREETL